jgi:cell division FtsZ-interacting protein ZapD
MAFLGWGVGAKSYCWLRVELLLHDLEFLRGAKHAAFLGRGVGAKSYCWLRVELLLHDLELFRVKLGQ